MIRQRGGIRWPSYSDRASLVLRVETCQRYVKVLDKLWTHGEDLEVGWGAAVTQSLIDKGEAR